MLCPSSSSNHTLIILVCIENENKGDVFPKNSWVETEKSFFLKQVDVSKCYQKKSEKKISSNLL